MNLKLSFAPLSQNALDLLVVVLDAEKTLHQIDDAEVAAHVARARAGFEAKTLKREYYATLPRARAPVRWSCTPRRSSRAGTCGERQDLHRARAAPGARLPAAAGRHPAERRRGRAAGGQGGGGAILGAYTFDRYRQEKDDFLAREAQITLLVHPDHRVDAEARKARYGWVSENVNLCRDLINEPGAAVTRR